MINFIKAQLLFTLFNNSYKDKMKAPCAFREIFTIFETISINVANESKIF